MSGISREKRRGALLCLAAYGAALAAAAAVALGLSSAHPLVAAGLADLAATLVVFAFSVGVNNSSMYDPYWSVAPLPLGAYFAFRGGVGEGDLTRALLVAALVTLWGARLTYNWWRGWTGLDHEDWRYEDIRAKSGRYYWPASFLGIHFFPTVLVYLGCLSLYSALSADARPFGALDVVAALVTGAAIFVEATADKQLHRFKARRRTESEILDEGLWAFSRHPNYFGEVLFWWGLFLFALAAAPSRVWVICGPVAMTALFVFISVPMIDKRMLARRPAYADRVKRVSALIPWPPKRG